MWRQAIVNVANGLPPKTIATDNSGVFDVDTFKGFAKVSEIELGSLDDSELIKAGMANFYRKVFVLCARAR